MSGRPAVAHEPPDRLGRVPGDPADPGDVAAFGGESKPPGEALVVHGRLVPRTGWGFPTRHVWSRGLLGPLPGKHNRSDGFSRRVRREAIGQRVGSPIVPP